MVTAVEVSGDNSESYVSGILECLPDILKSKFLKSIYYVLNNGLVFYDKLLPDPGVQLTPEDQYFTKDYFIDLHFKI